VTSVRLQRRRFSEATDIRRFPLGTVAVVELGDVVIGRLEYAPGWRWSTEVKPVAGTEWCEHHHVLVTVAGRLRMQLADGAEMETAPGEVAELPPGHDAWVVGEEPWIGFDVAGIRTYGRSKDSRVDRVLASIVMTDIVDSTRIAGELGPTRWRDLVAEHNRVAGEAIESRRGRLVKTTGDGLIAAFDGAEVAVRGAVAIRLATHDLGVSIRSGVHSGEVEVTVDDIRGLAVHTAARVMAVAAAGEILVSATVRDLVDGSDLVFEDAGVHELKGLHGPRQLYRLA
jgi:class 3 adenylate cyclase